MRDVTPDWVSENRIFDSDKSTVTASIPVSAIGSSYWYTGPATAKVTTYYRWQNMEVAYHGLATTETYSISITDSVSTTAALGAKLGASLESSGGIPGFGKVKATLSAEITTSLEVAKSQALTNTRTVEVKIPAHTYVAVWRLDQIVEIAYDPFTLPGNWAWGMQPIQLPSESYVVPVIINVSDSYTLPKLKPLPK
ncbi:MAG: hypothetical protein C0467_23075 [Planctomycetaceae bacterium]|nr:hypothetical protein [Planctomycetaceae bacterium]